MLCSNHCNNILVGAICYCIHPLQGTKSRHIGLRFSIERIMGNMKSYKSFQRYIPFTKSTHFWPLSLPCNLCTAFPWLKGKGSLGKYQQARILAVAKKCMCYYIHTYVINANVSQLGKETNMGTRVARSPSSTSPSFPSSLNTLDTRGNWNDWNWQHAWLG